MTKKIFKDPETSTTRIIVITYPIIPNFHVAECINPDTRHTKSAKPTKIPPKKYPIVEISRHRKTRFPVRLIVLSFSGSLSPTATISTAIYYCQLTLFAAPPANTVRIPSVFYCIVYSPPACHTRLILVFYQEASDAKLVM